MESYKLGIKFFIADAAAVEPSAYVPIFHSWIQKHLIADHLLIDVNGYEHVINGPAVVLVAHEANYTLDLSQGRPGLIYVRKRPLEGNFKSRVRHLFKSALTACKLLEEDKRLGGKIQFNAGEAQFRIHDRLLAPNTVETFAAVKPELAEACAEIYGNSTTRLEPRISPLELFEVHIETGKPSSVTSLLKSI